MPFQASGLLCKIPATRYVGGRILYIPFAMMAFSVQADEGFHRRGILQNLLLPLLSKLVIIDGLKA